MILFNLEFSYLHICANFGGGFSFYNGLLLVFGLLLLLNEIKDFVQNQEHFDDITLLYLKIKND